MHLPYCDNSLCIYHITSAYFPMRKLAVYYRRVELILSGLHSCKMVLKVFFFLTTLALVRLPTCNATVQQQQQQQAEQCVSKAEFDRVVTQMAAETAAVQSELNTWQNATINILKRFLLDNPALLLETVKDKLGSVQDKLEIMQYKMEQKQDKTNRLLDEFATLRNTTCTIDALTDLQHQIKQQQNETDREMAALENTIMDSQGNLQDKVATLQDKVINLQDKVDAFQNTTEASARKSYHEIVGLLQNTSCSLDRTEELQKQLENITEGLQHQLQSCNGTDISIQYLPTSCREIAQLNPHSPPGYYKISTTSGAVYCSMTTPDNPASPCQDIATQHPLASSGYYWVNSSNRTVVQVYCDMERHCCGSTGGWMRAAYLNMTDPTHHCPTGFRLTSHSKRSCERITTPGCTGLTFAVRSVNYSKVCGKVIGYQYASTNGILQGPSLTVDAYVDGVSITHGHPRRHIWTFAAALQESNYGGSRCPCIKTNTTYVPPFVGNDYFCDTGSRNRYQFKFYPDAPLWDGRGCGPTSSCCSFNSPPWFCKELPQPTTDDIEVRVCTNEVAASEDITIETIELYVQ